MILAKILKDRIDIQNKPISDSVKFHTIEFDFPESWDGYLKTAIFAFGDETPISVLFKDGNELYLGENKCYIPHEVLKAPRFSVSVYGMLGDSVATTAKAYVEVIESGFSEGVAPTDPTPSVYQQLVHLTDETKQIAQSVRNDADNGLFNGEKGEKGDRGEKGEKGDQGEKGEQGEPGNIENIDKVYNPESENAQSGTAIASALANCLSATEDTEWIFDGGNSKDAVSIDFTVDSQVSDISNNPIANKAIKGYTDARLADMSAVISQKNDETIQYIDGKTIDYIVEQLKTEDGIYRKWNSGIAECWKRVEVNDTARNTLFGGIYYTPEIVLGNFPSELFIDKPYICDISLQNPEFSSLIETGSKPTTKDVIGSVYLASTVSKESMYATICIYAMGYWKEEV